MEYSMVILAVVVIFIIIIWTINSSLSSMPSRAAVGSKGTTRPSNPTESLVVPAPPVSIPGAKMLTFAVFNVVGTDNPQAVSVTTGPILTAAMQAIQDQCSNEAATAHGFQCRFVDGLTHGSTTSNGKITVTDGMIPVLIANMGSYSNQAIAYHDIQLPAMNGSVALSTAQPLLDTCAPSTLLVYPGSPYMVIYAGVAAGGDGDLTGVQTFTYAWSHEVLETGADSFTIIQVQNYTACGNPTDVVPYELCDPLEFGTLNQMSYTKTVPSYMVGTTPTTTVRVANFVTKDWFNPWNNFQPVKPRVDYLGALVKPMTSFTGTGGVTNAAVLASRHRSSAPRRKDGSQLRRYISHDLRSHLVHQIMTSPPE